MKKLSIFFLYLLLGVFLIFSYKKINQILNFQQLKTPLSQSSFSLENAPSQSLRGTLVSLLGDVAWQSRIATEPAKITKPMQIQQGEKITTKEKGQALVVFSNVAEILMSPKTEISFIQTLPTNILIEQNSGTANYTQLNNGPLSVRSLDLVTRINKGEITVAVSEDQPYIVIEVKSGSITAGYNDLNYITKTLDVASGNRLLFRTDTKRVSITLLQ